MLWLALRFHRLALDLALRGAPGAEREPHAVYEDAALPRVHQCNAAARAAGMIPGMPLAAALGVCPRLHTHARRPAAEQEALENLAGWALGFTSQVSLRGPDGLLLEMGGSLRLLGGLEAALRKVRHGLARLGMRAHLAAAPVPAAAWMLCRAGRQEVIRDTGALAAALRPLPLAALELAPDTAGALASMGVATVGDCLRLPRAGLARRLGPELPALLDRALGRVPDPQPPWRPPPRYRGRLELPAAATDSTALVFAARRLLEELAGRLRATGTGIDALQLELEHEHGCERLPLTCGTLTRDADALQELVRARLEHHALPAPVHALGLRADHLPSLAPQSDELFPGAAARDREWRHLLARLAARLGGDALLAPAPAADHRPERAWRDGGGELHAPHFRHRPLWLLEEPQPLAVRAGTPWHGGRLRLLAGPERIEAGWWDGHAVQRDYFVAEDLQRRRLWIYREPHTPPRWFLHGLFG